MTACQPFEEVANFCSSTGISAAAFATIRAGLDYSEMKIVPISALSNRLKNVNIIPAVTAGSRDSNYAASTSIMLNIVTDNIHLSSRGISAKFHTIELTMEQLDNLIHRLECCKKSLESVSS